MHEADPRPHRHRILFICGADFYGPSEKIALGFAQELVARGHRVLIAIRGTEESLSMEVSGPLPEGLEVMVYRFSGKRIRDEDRERARSFDPTVVHVYNPRLPVVEAARQMFGHDRPLVVNFEDDEWGLKDLAGADLRRRISRLPGRLIAPLYPPGWPYANDRTLEWAAESADALHAITPELAREVEARLGRACNVLLPVQPLLRNVPADPPAPEGLEAVGDRPVVAFTGAVFGPQAEDFELLIRAVARSKAAGSDAVFVFAGSTAKRYDLARWTAEAGIDPETFVNLGYLRSDEVWGLLQRATVLVQPGKNSEFNRLRLPSKLQSYLASGTPTITFASGAGELFEDRVEVLKTYGEEEEELSDRMLELLGDSELRATLSEHGPEAARRLFDSVRNTEVLEGIYDEGAARFAAGGADR